MSGAANFLSRWSRLKREAEARPDADGPSPEGEVPADPAPVPALTADELAALPCLEDLTPETDLAPFLRTGVPASLRNAALRRMWSLDPAIRDRVGDALEYAYDWNTPGGVPGAGQLLACDDVQAMLGSIMNLPDAEASKGAASKGAATKPGPASAEHVVPEEDVRAPPDSPPEPPLELPAGEPARPQGTAISQTEPTPEAMPAPIRRHGGATPF